MTGPGHWYSLFWTCLTETKPRRGRTSVEWESLVQGETFEVCCWIGQGLAMTTGPGWRGGNLAGAELYHFRLDLKGSAQPPPLALLVRAEGTR